MSAGRQSQHVASMRKDRSSYRQRATPSPRRQEEMVKGALATEVVVKEKQGVEAPRR